MPVFALTNEIFFPPPQLASPEGLLAVGGDLHPERLLLAYTSGIFPWPVEGMPLLWHSPDPRMVLTTEAMKVSRSLRKTLRRGTFEITLDKAFEEVITACATIYRPDQGGTWINEEMVEAYMNLHALGFAHSVEAWRGMNLVGGLYGVSIGTAFFGESMFAKVADASKAAFATLVKQLEVWGIHLIDCQVYTPHLASFGAVQWPRRRFLAELRGCIRQPTRSGPWAFDSDLVVVEP